MAHMVESAIEQTFMAFEDQDYTMAEDVIKGDRTVNDMERAIESRCLSLILRQQPVASDLRQGLATLAEAGVKTGEIQPLADNLPAQLKITAEPFKARVRPPKTRQAMRVSHWLFSSLRWEMKIAP